jgi:hypothetical protein
MTRLISSLLFVLVAIQISSLRAQSGGNPRSGFSLTLRQLPHVAGKPETMLGLDVKYTNISNKKEYEAMCGTYGALYHLAVTYNGVTVKESEEDRKRRIVAQSNTCRFMSGTQRDLEPGQSRDDILSYDAVKPGTYVFSVDVDTDPLNPKSNANVKSNSITVVMPSPGVATPK